MPCWQPSELKEERTSFCPSVPQRGLSLAKFSTSSSRTLVKENKLLLFYTIRFAIICYSSLSKLIQHPLRRHRNCRLQEGKQSDILRLGGKGPKRFIFYQPKGKKWSLSTSDIEFMLSTILPRKTPSFLHPHILSSFPFLY